MNRELNEQRYLAGIGRLRENSSPAPLKVKSVTVAGVKALLKKEMFRARNEYYALSRCADISDGVTIRELSKGKMRGKVLVPDPQNTKFEVVWYLGKYGAQRRDREDYATIQDAVEKINSVRPQADAIAAEELAGG